jgi:ankyrin repeat protein
MIRKLTAKSSLDSLKKEAKRWLKSLRAGEPEALARLNQVLPRADAACGLREIQQALAREHGSASWADLKLQVMDEALARRTHAERLAEFLEHAIVNYGIPPSGRQWDPSYPDDPSRREYAARILAKHPETAHGSVHAVVVCGDVVELKRVLEQDPRAASLKGGRRMWEPLLYLAFGRLPVAAAVENSVEIARLLLDFGADPNVQMTDGENPFTALTGVIGEGERTPAQVPPHPRAEQLVRLLIERGANPFDTQALYNTSLWHDSTLWLDLLYGYAERAGTTALWNEAAEGRRGQLDYLLGNAVDRNHVRRVQWLLAHGADAQTRHAYTGRHLHSTAVLHGYSQIAEVLANAGAEVEELKGYDAFQAACLRLDRDTARNLAKQHPEHTRDAAALLMAARTGRADVVELLLDLGVLPDTQSADGERALHAAAWADSIAVARLLVERGAEIDARERKYGATPLSWAIYLGKPQLVEYLSTLSSDVISLAAAGKLGRLRSLLDAQPSLAKMLQNDRTALFALPEADENLAIAIAELLLSHGADARHPNRQGRTAADEAERNGMDALAQILRDAQLGSG